jgi:CheY-like chemotaxis protein
MQTILVIDDNLEIRNSICFLLESEGYNVLFAQNGKEGIEFALENKPDLILCDFHLPDKNGAMIYEELKTHTSMMPIPFIFISGESIPIIPSQKDSKDRIYLIKKPFRISELLIKIKEVILSSGGNFGQQ